MHIKKIPGFKPRLAHKFILLTSILLVVSFSCLGFYFISYQKELLYADIHELAEALAGNLAANAAFGLVTYDSEELQSLLKSLGRCRDIVYAWIEDKNGEKISEYQNSEWQDKIGNAWQEITSFSASRLKTLNSSRTSLKDRQLSVRYEPGQGPGILFMCLPVKAELYGYNEELVIGAPDGQSSMIGHACLGISLKRVQDSMHTASTRSLAIIIVIAIIAIFMSRFLAHWISTPLIRLRDAADEMTAGILPSKIDVPSEDEVGELADAFNKMVEQVLQGKKALEKAYAELEQTNMSLEEQVAFRTEELRESIMELTAARDCLQEAYAEMKSMHDAKSGFLRTASHELRTPLTAIKANVDYLLKYERERLGDEGIKMLEAVKRNTNNMKQLVEDMLQVVRIDSDTLELDIETVNLYDLVTECAAELRAIQTCSLHIDIDRGLTLEADSAKLHDVFVNLLSNAYRFTPPDGEVRITARQKDGRLHITVADTGAGIADRHLPHIFDPFYQAEHGRGGTGLGLAIAKGIIERHAGSIEAVSESGRGTRFTIMI